MLYYTNKKKCMYKHIPALQEIFIVKGIITHFISLN